MHAEEHEQTLGTASLVRRLALLLILSTLAGFSGGYIGLEFHQQVATGVFLSIILGTLFFWSFRLAVAFLGVAVLIFTKSLNIPHFVESAALPVILFLVGMMIVVGALRDLGFFTWVVQMIVSMPNMTAHKFIITLCLASSLLACAVDEVTSIIFVSTLVFQVCERLKLNPAPYLITCVLCTNVGSAGTMLGNPVGIYIGTQAGFSFHDFLFWAFPIMLLCLAATIGVTTLWYRKDLREFDERLAERLSHNLSLAPRVDIPYKKGLVILLLTVLFIAAHHSLEGALGLDKNSILLIAPLVCSGIIMIMRHDRARHYVEHEVDWWTLLFFMLLFAVAGTLEYTGVTVFMAEYFQDSFGANIAVLVPVILLVTALGSAFVDNVVFVAAFSPIIKEMAHTLPSMPLWWALLFGACFGGNITMIGSTANIVALGMLEKHSKTHVSFFAWLKIGLLCALVTCLIVWGCLLLLTPYMTAI